MPIVFKKLHPNSKLPSRGSPEAAGLDLYSIESVEIQPRSWFPVRTGISVLLDRGFEGQVRPRSGLALRYGVTVLNAPGTIDSDFRGEIKVLLVNHSDSPVKFNVGDRVAQLVIARVEMADPTWTDDDLQPTTRGEGGFGSTGK